MASAKWKKWVTAANLKKIEQWAAQGLSDKEIATKCMKISCSTYYDYKKQHKEIAEALEKGRAVSVEVVVNALFSRAKGGYVTETVTEKITDHKGQVTIKEKVCTRYIPPDVGAIAYYLKCKDPDHWKDKLSEYQEKKLEMDKVRLDLEKEKVENASW